MVIAEIAGRRVEYDAGIWKADDPAFAGALADAAAGYDAGAEYRPDPDRAIVDFVIDFFGSGRIVSADDPAAGDEPGVVY